MNKSELIQNYLGGIVACRQNIRELELKISATKNFDKVNTLIQRVHIQQNSISQYERLIRTVENLCIDRGEERASAPQNSDTEEMIGQSSFRGNTVRYIYDKCANYGDQLLKAGNFLREAHTFIECCDCEQDLDRKNKWLEEVKAFCSIRQ